ncbi:hypothetical protein [Micromonospora taraxaci]|uniref:hypothetical protein n=1 Tax=Micromonospora taraxaci TaxID=1316803 RepID=UPI0033A6DECB
MLGGFFDRASPETRKWAVGYLGRILRDAAGLDATTIERAKGLGEWRKTRLEFDAPEARRSEAEAFAWWADSQKLDRHWRIERFEFVLNLGASPDPESVTYSGLADIANEYPLRAVHALRKYLELNRDGWGIHVARDEIRKILRQALDGPDPAGVEAALDTLHWLGSLGFTEFRDLVRNPT